jgi:hypothetical protein
VYLIPSRVNSYLHPFPFVKYALIEILLPWKEQRTPELPAAQYLPMLINPGWAFAEIESDLLRRHNRRILIGVKF